MNTRRSGFSITHRRLLRFGWAIGLILPLAPAAAAPPAATPAPKDIEFFERKVRPLFVKHCYSCHSAEAKKLRGDLRLDTRAGVRDGGADGPILVPGKPDKSSLVERVKSRDPGRRMPPKGGLSAAEIADLAAWVKMGASDPRTDNTTAKQPPARDLWSLHPVAHPAAPAVKDGKWPVNDIDRFVLAKLEEKKLRPAAPADKRTLIRRASYDLTGLPPTPEEIDAFLKDESPTAFATVVDRLLASPAYGERWGRHWMDVIRYADTAGDNSDYPIPQMYRYRNWIIAAFNSDMPYDDFVRRQIAGDLLPAKSDAERLANVVATGYLGNAKRFGSYEDARYPWHLTIEDTIDNLGRTFLGLTINCARCHDHKFDPISAEDYYALYGFFQSTRYPWAGTELDNKQHDLVPLAPAAQMAAAEKERAAKFAALDARLAQLEKDRKKAEQALAAAEKEKDAGKRKSRVAEANKRVASFKGKVKAARKEREAVGRAPLPFEMAYAVAEGRNQGKHVVGNARVQIKGEPERLGREVPRRFPTALGGQQLPANIKGSGRRQLADWITDPKNPLTARVMVNRIWQWHLGTGIVRTSSNFGKMGVEPTHPELLDYLATRFMKDGWSVKRLHRLVMLSRAYQMASGEDDANAAIDVGNDYLWRFPPRRLDAEAIRDTMLVVSGALDRSVGGPHPFPPASKWNYTQHNPFKAVYDTNRRSVYLMTQRIQRHPFLALFDGADTNASTAARTTTTTPLQALYLMNNPFVHETARKFAARMLAERPDDGKRVERAYVLLFGRPPSAGEAAAARDYLKQARAKLGKVPAKERDAKAWESLARALFMCNEFVYVN
jgi:hypothetical protein